MEPIPPSLLQTLSIQLPMSLLPVSKEYASYLTKTDGEEHRSVATVPMPVTGYRISWQGTPQWWEPRSYPEAEADLGKKVIIAMPAPKHFSDQGMEL